MVDRSKYAKSSQQSVSNIMFWAVGILLVFTMLSVWFVCGLYAKYVVTDSASDSARVAEGSDFELWEHKANLVNGIYVLDEEEKVLENAYEKVIPGVDIAKDPFISIDAELEVSYQLYIRVIESAYFPENVTYELTEDWELVNKTLNIYKYKYVFDAGSKYKDEIQILKNDKLYVGEHYVGEGKEFSLAFDAWMRQVD